MSFIKIKFLDCKNKDYLIQKILNTDENYRVSLEKILLLLLAFHIFV